MRAPRRRMLALLLGGSAAAHAGASGGRAGTRHRRQGRPADSGVAVQLGGGDRAGGLVRRAVDAVAHATTAERAPARRLLRARRGTGAARASRPCWTHCGASASALFALVLYSGFDGAQVPNANFSVTFIYVIFWVGLPVLSVLFGDVFASLSPWRACARCARGLRAAGCARGRRAARCAIPPARHVAGGLRHRRLRLAGAGVCQSRRTVDCWRRCRSAISR